MTNDDIVALLRRHQPAALRVHLVDGGVRELAPPGGRRKRWASVVATLDEYHWSSVELLNQRSQVLHAWENDAPAHEVEDLDGAEGIGGGVSNVAALVNLNLKAMDVALRRHGEHSAALVGALVKVAEATAGTLQAMQRMFGANLEHLEKLRSMSADDESDAAGGGTMSGEAMVELLHLLRERKPRRLAPGANGDGAKGEVE